MSDPNGHRARTTPNRPTRSGTSGNGRIDAETARQQRIDQMFRQQGLRGQRLQGRQDWFRNLSRREQDRVIQEAGLRAEINRLEPRRTYVGLGGNRVPTQTHIRNLREQLDSLNGICRPEGIPQNWIRNPTRDPGGANFYNPNNPKKGDAVRVMPGNTNSPHPASQQPYVRWQREGQALDVNGNPVARNTPDAHIPLNQFRFNRDFFE
jgi:hypothetical protein